MIILAFVGVVWLGAAVGVVVFVKWVAKRFSLEDEAAAVVAEAERIKDEAVK